MDFTALESLVIEQKQPLFRLKQLKDSINKGITSYSSVKGWPQNLVLACETIPMYSFTNSLISSSSDGTKKALLVLHDGQKIETVLMEPKPGHLSVCVSSEVGCPMGCAFCATGSLGFKRFLSTEEICDQVLFWKHYCLAQGHKQPTSVVFMGMGEPFHNTENVFNSLQWLNAWYGVGNRHLSISTCGIPEGINLLAQKFDQVNLAISLHAASESTRIQLMPIAKRYSLNQLKESLLHYLKITNRQVMFEYLLIQGVNDQENDLIALQTFVKSFPKQLIHINLIRYNQTFEKFTPSPVSIVKQWKEWLLSRHISASIRKNLGTDIDGACGQLAAKTVL